MKLFSLFPLVLLAPLDGANARNWPTHIVMDPAKSDAGTFAEELREHGRKVRLVLIPVLLMLAIGLGSYALGRAGDWAAFASLAGGVAVLGWSRTGGFRRKLELLGNAAQVATMERLYGVATADAVAREAARLTGGYGGLFKGRPVALLLHAELADARAWIGPRLKLITRFKEQVR